MANLLAWHHYKQAPSYIAHGGILPFEPSNSFFLYQTNTRCNLFVARAIRIRLRLCLQMQTVEEVAQATPFQRSDGVQPVQFFTSKTSRHYRIAPDRQLCFAIAFFGRLASRQCIPRYREGAIRYGARLLYQALDLRLSSISTACFPVTAYISIACIDFSAFSSSACLATSSPHL